MSQNSAHSGQKNIYNSILENILTFSILHFLVSKTTSLGVLFTFSCIIQGVLSQDITSISFLFGLSITSFSHTLLIALFKKVLSEIISF
jgi:hypothetical protein